jgi:hypothetical protein
MPENPTFPATFLPFPSLNNLHGSENAFHVNAF